MVSERWWRGARQPAAAPGGAACLRSTPAVRCPLPLQDGAEFGKIGRYYAVESMLLWDPVAERYVADQTPSYGTDTLEDFFRKAVTEGLKGQELGDQAVFGVNKE